MRAGTRHGLPALTCALALVVAGCTSDGDESSSEPTSPGPSESSGTSTSPADPGGTAAPQPTDDRPRALACYLLDGDQALATEGDVPAVPCRDEHTAVTYSTGLLDQSAASGSAEDPRVRRQVAATCNRRLARFLGGSLEQRRLSLLTKVWFTPTAEQAADGARWFRCDVVAPYSGGRLMTLPPPRKLRGILRTPGPRNAFATCGTARPGTKGFRRVPCSNRHTWRAVATVSLGRGAYPSDSEVFDRMDGRCTNAARQRARDKFSFSWAEERPTRAQWRAGLRYGYCWTAVRS